MREIHILCFTDLHGDLKALARIKESVKEEKPDFLLCAGDITIFEQDIKGILNKINSLGAPVFLTHGNHEEEKRLRKLCAPLKNVTFLHDEHTQVKGWTVAAYGGDGFSERSAAVEQLIEKWKDLNWPHTLFISHAPPYKTAVDDIGEKGDTWHVGSKSLTKLIKKRQPAFVICGHIHETFGKYDTIGKTLILNPGKKGKFLKVEEK